MILFTTVFFGAGLETKIRIDFLIMQFAPCKDRTRQCQETCEPGCIIPRNKLYSLAFPLLSYFSFQKKNCFTSVQFQFLCNICLHSEKGSHQIVIFVNHSSLKTSSYSFYKIQPGATLHVPSRLVKDC